MRPGANGTVTSCPAFFAACSTAAQPPRTIRSASETLLPPDCEPLKSCWICSSVCSALASSAGSLTSQSFCGARRIRAPLAPPRLSVPRKRRRRRPGGGDQLRDGQPRGEDLALEGGDVRVADQLVVDRGDGVLPQLRLGDPRAEVARHRPHVAVQQLVPGLGERVGELVRVLVEALRDRPVDRVEPQREVRRQHHRRVPLRRVVRVRHGALGLGVLRASTACAPAGLVVSSQSYVEQVVEEAVVPLRRLVGPGALEPAGDRVGALAAAEAVLPAEALLLDRGSPRAPGRRRSRVDRAVGLAERVAADDERDRLLVVHRHAGEGLADVRGGGQRIRVAVRPLRVHVDQAHLHGAEADRRARGRRCSARRRARCPPGPRRSPRAPRCPRARSRSRTS